jgi:hypothetical protein
MLLDYTCTKSESKIDRYRYRETATSLINVTTFVNLVSYGHDLILKICEDTDEIKSRIIWSAALFLKVTNMIIVNPYLNKIRAFQYITILSDRVSLKPLINIEYFFLNSFRVSSVKFLESMRILRNITDNPMIIIERADIARIDDRKEIISFLLNLKSRRLIKLHVSNGEN